MGIDCRGGPLWPPQREHSTLGWPQRATPTKMKAPITLPVTDPFVGRTLDEKYCVEERLGAGGMGAVYRARHLSMDRPVAIKVLHQRLLEDEVARLRFQIEARAAVHLRHSNAVSVTDFGQTSEG